MTRRPIDIQRDSGGSFRLEAEDDGTPISEICQLNDTLLLITKKAVYEIKTADQIDPGRQNPNIPHHVQRRILAFGTDSELVCRTLLTAKNLFQPRFLPASIDVKRAVSLTFDILKDLAAMHEGATELHHRSNFRSHLRLSRSVPGGLHWFAVLDRRSARAKVDESTPKCFQNLHHRGE